MSEGLLAGSPWTTGARASATIPELKSMMSEEERCNFLKRCPTKYSSDVVVDILCVFWEERCPI
jgi:hypothetical protein